MENQDKYQYIDHSKTLFTYLLITLIILGSFLRFYQIGKLSFWLDETFTISIVGNNLESLINALATNANMRLFYIVVYLWRQIFPNASDGVLRTLPAIFSVANIPVMFFLGRSITRNQKEATWIGIVSALLTSINSTNIQYAQEFRSYSLTMLLATLSTLYFIRVVNDPDVKAKRLVTYVLLTIAAIYSHMHVVFLIGTHGLTLLILLITKKLDNQKFMKLMICYGAIAFSLIPIAITSIQKGAILTSFLQEPTIYAIKSFLDFITGYQEPLLVIIYFFLGIIGLASGIYVLLHKDFFTSWNYLVLTSCFILPIFFTYGFSKLVSPIFTDRYLLFVLPYLTILASVGIVKLIINNLKKKGWRVLVTSLGIVALITLGYLSGKSLKSYYDTFQKEDWREATRFLSSNCPGSIVLYYPKFIENSVLYYDQTLHSTGNEWVNDIVNNNPEAESLVEAFPNNDDRVCLVLSHTEIGQRAEIAELIKNSIQVDFPNSSYANYYGVRIEIYTP